jgi:hypothetical protein
MLARQFDCNFCPKLIVLPISDPPEQARHQLAPNATDQPRNALCPHCSRAGAYPVEVLAELKPVNDTVELQRLENQVSVCLCLPCGESGCEGLVRMYTTMPLSPTLTKDAEGLAAGLEYFGPCCDGRSQQHRKFGHPAGDSLVYLYLNYYG